MAIKCPNCGNENPDDYAYCDECGARLDGGTATATAAPTTPSVESAMPVGTLGAPPAAGTAPVPVAGSAAASGSGLIRCPHCGTENMAGAAFCDECGASLADATPGVGAVPATPASAVMEAPTGEGPLVHPMAAPDATHADSEPYSAGAMPTMPEGPAAMDPNMAAPTMPATPPPPAPPPVEAAPVAAVPMPPPVTEDTVPPVAAPSGAEWQPPIAAPAPPMPIMTAPPVETPAATGVQHCAHCGAELKPGARFCHRCGTLVAQPQVTCRNCGNPLEPDALFCENCGTPTGVGAAPAASAAPAAPPAPVVDVFTPVAPVAPPVNPAPASVATPVETVAPVVPSAPAIPVGIVTPPPAGGPPRLELTASGATVALPDKDDILVGREDPMSEPPIFPDIDLTPYGGEEGGVSRRHARIFRQNGQYFLEDLHATNYTKLDGAKLTPRTPLPLHNGARIDFGRVTVFFRM